MATVPLEMISLRMVFKGFPSTAREVRPSIRESSGGRELRSLLVRSRRRSDVIPVMFPGTAETCKKRAGFRAIIKERVSYTEGDIYRTGKRIRVE